MQEKYGTKDFRKVLDCMDDGEYKRYSKLLGNNPVFNKRATTAKISTPQKAPTPTKAKTSKRANEYYTKKQLDEMSLPKIRKIAEKTAIEYYKSGLSGISFGASTPEHVAEALAKRGTATSLKKDIMSMQRKLKQRK
jgi:hypothetical protein